LGLAPCNVFDLFGLALFAIFPRRRCTPPQGVGKLSQHFPLLFFFVLLSFFFLGLEVGNVWQIMNIILKYLRSPAVCFTSKINYVICPRVFLVCFCFAFSIRPVGALVPKPRSYHLSDCTPDP
jgi:hypothetical protein